MGHRRSVHGLSQLIVLSAFGAALLPAAAAGPARAADPVTALFADGPGFPADGVPENLGPDAGWNLAVGVDPSVLFVTVGQPGDQWGFTFASAPGTTLTPGSYDNAVAPQSRTAGVSGVSVSRGNYSCGVFSGSFTVLELTVDSGTVTSAAIDFEIHCDAQTTAVFGSIRFQASHGYRGIAISPFPQPPPLAVGDAVVGHQTIQDIVVTATGTDPVSVDHVSVSGSGFSIVADPCTGTLAGGSTCTIQVGFTPPALGVTSGTFELADDVLATGHGFGLAGNGLAAALTPASVDFGEADEYTSGGTRTFTLVNGPNPLTGIAPSVSTNHLSFSLAKGTCGSTLAAGASCTITVSYVPQFAGADSASLFVPTNEVQGLGGSVTGVGNPGTKIRWDQTHGVGFWNWNDGAALARTTTSSAAYLHAVSAAAVVGSKVVTDTGPYEPILYRRSSSSVGRTWTTAYRVNPSTQHGDRPTIAAAGAYVYVAWVRLSKVVHYSHTAARILDVRANSANGSSTGWKPIHRLTSTTGRVDYPVIAASGASVYLVWTDSVTGSVRIATSRDHGSTWHTATLGSTSSTTSDGREGMPSVAASGSRITVAWISNRNGAVLARTSTNSGGTWAPAVTLAYSSGHFVSVAVLGTRSAVAWSTDRTVHIRTQSSATWGPTLPVTPPGVASYYTQAFEPVVALQGSSAIGVAFTACVTTCPDSASRLADLVWGESSDGGATWGRQVIGWYDYGAGGQKFLASVVWPSATQRYVMWNGDPVDSGYGLYIRPGTGAP